MATVAAKLKGARISARKARLVADQVRGLAVGKAMDILGFSNKKAAELIRKLLESAVANAGHNAGCDVDDLHVSEIYVDEGRTQKRWKPRARGRSDRIDKPSSHIVLKVCDEKTKAGGR